MDGIRIYPEKEDDFKKISKFWTKEVRVLQLQDWGWKIIANVLEIEIRIQENRIIPEELTTWLRNFQYYKDGDTENKTGKKFTWQSCWSIFQSHHPVKKFTELLKLFFWKTKYNQKARTNVLQCYRCQSFGHKWSRYRQSPRCVKCTCSYLKEGFSKSRNNRQMCQLRQPAPPQLQGLQAARVDAETKHQ